MITMAMAMFEVDSLMGHTPYDTCTQGIMVVVCIMLLTSLRLCMQLLSFPAHVSHIGNGVHNVINNYDYCMYCIV